MMKNISLVIIILCISSSLFSQKSKWEKSKEIGISVGSIYYIGDINPHKHFGPTLKIGGGLVYRENISKRWTIKISALWGRIEASDAQSDDPWQQNRNLSFRNDIIEGSLQAELNFFDYQIGSEDFISPYLLMGLSYYSMKPQANYLGTWYELQPLGTEGQGTSVGELPYKTTGLAVPIGLGVKVNLFSIVGLSLEWGIRKTWTDYIDDVSGTYTSSGLLEDENGHLSQLLADRSLEQEGTENDGLQRGDPGRNDWYAFVQGMLTFRIDKKPTTCTQNHHFR